MRFDYMAQRPCKVKTLLKEHDVSRSLLAKVKFKGGGIWVNGREENAIYPLAVGDVVTIEIPDERSERDSLTPVRHPLAIVYEDDHFLVINKPHGYASIPSVNHSNTMANFVKQYYLDQGYPNQLIHIVTRLDKDTSGLMLFAKHGYAHARMDKQLQMKQIDKRYYALVKGDSDLPETGDIIAPIARDEESIITRRVAASGKYAHTSYRLEAQYGDIKLVDIKLHTGRTHQIRVHFAHIGHPLLGDDMYGGSLEHGIKRQALHCYQLSFTHPFTQEELTIQSPLTDDFENVIMNYEK